MFEAENLSCNFSSFSRGEQIFKSISAMSTPFNLPTYNTQALGSFSSKNLIS